MWARKLSRGPFPPDVFRLLTAHPAVAPGGGGRVYLSHLHSNGGLSTGPSARSADQMPEETARGPPAGSTRLQAGAPAMRKALRDAHTCTQTTLSLEMFAKVDGITGSRAGGAAAGGSLNIIARCWVTGPGLVTRENKEE